MPQFSKILLNCLRQIENSEIRLPTTPNAFESLSMTVNATGLSPVLPGAKNTDRFVVSKGLLTVIRRTVKSYPVPESVGENTELVMEVAVKVSLWNRQADLQQPICDHPRNRG